MGAFILRMNKLLYEKELNGSIIRVYEIDGEIIFQKDEDIFATCYDLLAVAIKECNVVEAFRIIGMLDRFCSGDDTYWTLRFAVKSYVMDCEIKQKQSKNKSGKSESHKTYLMKDSNTNYTKIGKSINPQKRESTLQSEKPTIELLKVCDDLVETELHKKYASNRIRGEWFDLSDNDIQEICSEYKFIDV